MKATERQAILRSALPATTEDLSAKHPKVWPLVKNGAREPRSRVLARDLAAIGALRSKVGLWRMPRVCSVAGCGARLGNSGKSGLCRVHERARREAAAKAPAPVLKATGPEVVSMPFRPWVHGNNAAWLGVATWRDQVRRGVGDVALPTSVAMPSRRWVYGPRSAEVRQ